MKAITIKQPWASLIVEGIKDIENRTWKTNFRGRILIHAGEDRKNTLDILNENQFNDLCHSKCAMYFGKTLRQNWVRGAIIGCVEIVDCVINHPSIWAEKTPTGFIGEYELPIHEDQIVYNWVLANPIKFDKPIPCKGKLSFWEFDIVTKAREMYSKGEINFSELTLIEELI